MGNFLLGILQPSDVVGNIADGLLLTGHGGNDVLHLCGTNGIIRGFIDPLPSSHLHLRILQT